MWKMSRLRLSCTLFIYVALSSPACTADGWVLSKSKHCPHWILPGTAVKCVGLQPATDVFYNCCMYSPCLPWFHWDPEPLERQEVLSPLYLPGRRWGLVCFLRNSKMYTRSMRKYNMATHRLANYSLWPDFSTLASVTLQETSEVRKFGSKFGLFSWLKFSLFFVIYLRPRNSLHTSLTGDTRFTLRDGWLVLQTREHNVISSIKVLFSNYFCGKSMLPRVRGCQIRRHGLWVQIHPKGGVEMMRE